MARAPLTPKQVAFVQEYLIDLCATQAAIRAGYSAKTANVTGAKLLANAKVCAAVAAAQKARSERTQITADDVVRQLALLAFADPNELVEYRRTCCRHCYGDDFEFQETEREQDKRRHEREAAWVKRKNAKPTDVFEFDELGGIGFNALKDPNGACPNCHGLGIERAVVKDTRALSPAGRRLYAGVKQTKEGIEVKMHDQLNALIQIGRHLGMFVDKQERSGPERWPTGVARHPHYRRPARRRQ